MEAFVSRKAVENRPSGGDEVPVGDVIGYIEDGA